jgi:CBS-domain-containing membrane protein
MIGVKYSLLILHLQPMEKTAEIMLENKIGKFPIIDDNKLLAGIVTVTDLGIFLLPRRGPSITLSKLQAI